MRYHDYLRQRYRVLLGYSGGLLMTIGLFFLVPLLLLFFYPDEAHVIDSFLIAALPLVIGGFVLWRWFSPDDPMSLTLQEGAVIVVIVWLVASVMGGLPFITTVNLNFTQAVFESTSGWTTTGLSVVDVTQAPRTILLYRSIIQLVGGAGFVIFAISAISGPTGAGLSAAEGRTDQLAPHVRRSASIVLRIYLSYIFVGVLAFKLAGMGWFDAVNHSFTAVATGGFSTKAESIGHWDSAAIEAVAIVLMLLGQLNFLTAFTLLRRKFRPVILNGEVRLMALLLPVAMILLFLIVTLSIYPAQDKAVRVAIFESVSALSGTGFASVSYLPWNEFGWLVLVVLMVIGGGSGSTAGGIKQIRIYLLYKGVRWELQRAFMPPHSINEPAVWQGDQRSFLTDRTLRQVALFVFVYLFVLIAGTGYMAAHGYGLAESLFEYASTLGTVGLSVGVTSLTTPPSLMWAQTIGMLLGRLEIFIVAIGVIKLLSDGRTLLLADEND